MKMKRLKKISLAYVLQICAVLVIFGYPVNSSTNKPKEPSENNKTAENIFVPAAEIKTWSGKTADAPKFQVKFK